MAKPETNQPDSLLATHFGDPCIHCATALDDVASGPCAGDPAKAVVIGYASLGVRWDGVERYRYRLSTNEVREEWNHVSLHRPYYHFGRSDTLTNPPPYDARLRATADGPTTPTLETIPTEGGQTWPTS